MYNGVGLPTARGSGTNGYVQRNLANITVKRTKPNYRSEDDIKMLESTLNRPPNLEILDHQKKRQIELRCLELRELMEEQKYSDDVIEDKVNEYRTLLMTQKAKTDSTKNSTANMTDEHGRPIATETHQIAHLQMQKNQRLCEAFGIGKDYVDGSSMERIKPAGKRSAAQIAEPTQRNSGTVPGGANDNKNENAKATIKKVKEETDSDSSTSSSSSSSSDDDSSDSSSSDEESDNKSELSYLSETDYKLPPDQLRSVVVLANPKRTHRDLSDIDRSDDDDVKPLQQTRNGDRRGEPSRRQQDTVQTPEVSEPQTRRRRSSSGSPKRIRVNDETETKQSKHHHHSPPKDAPPRRPRSRERHSPAVTDVNQSSDKRRNDELRDERPKLDGKKSADNDRATARRRRSSNDKASVDRHNSQKELAATSSRTQQSAKPKESSNIHRETSTVKRQESKKRGMDKTAPRNKRRRRETTSSESDSSSDDSSSSDSSSSTESTSSDDSIPKRRGSPNFKERRRITRSSSASSPEVRRRSKDGQDSSKSSTKRRRH